MRLLKEQIIGKYNLAFLCTMGYYELDHTYYYKNIATGIFEIMPAMFLIGATNNIKIRMIKLLKREYPYLERFFMFQCEVNSPENQRNKNVIELLLSEINEIYNMIEETNNES